MKDDVVDYDVKDLTVELRRTDERTSEDWMPLVQLTGGIDNFSVKQVQTPSGLKTTIEFTTLGGNVVARDYDRSERRHEIAAQLLKSARPS